MNVRPLLQVALAGLWLAQAGAALTAAEFPMVTWTGEAMGSRYRVSLVDPRLAPADQASIQREVDDRFQALNRLLSHYLPDSELSRFNRAPAGTPIAISPELAAVTQCALEVSRRSQGAFDPTLAPLINLWGFGEQGPARAMPAPEAIQAARQMTGWQHLNLTPQGQLSKQLPGLSLNLSGLGKGFAVDEVFQLLHRRGFTNLYVSLAGEIRVGGHNARGGPWLIGISAPLELWREKDPMAAAVPLRNLAISTSGDYQKFFRDPAGRRLAHILDPRTGRPVQHELGSVSVVAPQGLLADALSTTLFVLGPKEGLQFIEGWTNAAALLVVRETEDRFRLVPSSRFATLTGWQPPPAQP